MRVLLIGMDTDTVETVFLSLRLRWPDVQPLASTEAETGVSLLEQESPDMVILQASSSGRRYPG